MDCNIYWTVGLIIIQGEFSMSTLLTFCNNGNGKISFWRYLNDNRNWFLMYQKISSNVQKWRIGWLTTKSWHINHYQKVLILKVFTKYCCLEVSVLLSLLYKVRTIKVNKFSNLDSLLFWTVWLTHLKTAIIVLLLPKRLKQGMYHWNKGQFFWKTNFYQ